MGLGYGLIFRRFFWKSTCLSTNFFYLDGSLGGQRIFPNYWNEGQSYLLRQTQDIFLLLGNLFSLISLKTKLPVSSVQWGKYNYFFHVSIKYICLHYCIYYVLQINHAYFSNLLKLGSDVDIASDVNQFLIVR